MLPTLRRFPARGGLQLFALLCAMITVASSVRAATITVTTTADSGAGSLRDAIAAANDGDTIQFDASLNGQSITLTSGELVIDRPLTIEGPGADQLAVTKPSGTLDFPLLHVLPGRFVLIKGLTLDGNGTPGSGLWNDHATVTIDGCVVQGCLGSGVRCYASFNDDSYLLITNSTIRDNHNDTNGGGIYNEAANGAHAILTIRDSVVRNNTVGSFSGTAGGGVWNSGEMDVTSSTVIDNLAGGNGPDFPFGAGGGIWNNGFTMFVADCTISGNSAGINGGGIYNSGVFASIGSSTLSGNAANGINELEGWGDGAGIYNGSTMTITNCTLSANDSTRSGGAVSNHGPLTIGHSTFSGNIALEGGTIANYSGGTLQIGNTALKVSTSSPSISNISGSITSNGYNLINDNGGGFLTGPGDQINTEPMLGPLQDNGGPTFTHELLTGSPAIDTGDPSFMPPPANDQRGSLYQRVFNKRIDIGSLEVQPTPPKPTPSSTPIPTATPEATPTPPPPATPSPTPTPPPPTPTPTPGPTATPSPTAAQALNISTRLRVGTGNNIMIGGFIITGNESKTVALRGIGPSLANSGLTDVLPDPILELRGPDGALLRQNDNWQDDAFGGKPLFNLGLGLDHYAESGMVASLKPGPYTVLLAGKNQTSGLGLVEIYDVDAAADSHLANISTRGFVETGASVMIGGFILGGGNDTRIAVRGIGPSLAEFGLDPVLANPTLELRNGDGALLISNDNWQDDVEQAMQLSAAGLAPTDANESGIVASLPPGVFTVILAGKNGGTGIGLVEVYDLGGPP